MTRTTPITKKERENVTRAEMVARYVNTNEKTIGVDSDVESARNANSSKAIKELIKNFNYKIQMLIPQKQNKTKWKI